MKPVVRKWIRIIGLLLCSLLIALIVVFVLHRPSMKVVAQWPQPETINYHSFGPYYLSVVEDDLDWRGFPFQVGRNYFIYVGRDKGTPSYGHMLKYSFHPDSPDMEQFIQQSRVEWTKEGVTFCPPSGHRVFIPQKMFLGGR